MAERVSRKDGSVSWSRDVIVRKDGKTPVADQERICGDDNGREGQATISIGGGKGKPKDEV